MRTMHRNSIMIASNFGHKSIDLSLLDAGRRP
jgi:hypothetical protein